MATLSTTDYNVAIVIKYNELTGVIVVLEYSHHIEALSCVKLNNVITINLERG